MRRLLIAIALVRVVMTATLRIPISLVSMSASALSTRTPTKVSGTTKRSTLKSCPGSRRLFPYVRRPEDIRVADFNRYCLRRACKMRSIILTQMGIMDIEYAGRDIPQFKVT